MSSQISPRRRYPATALEQRMSELDERLRIARAESDALRGRVSPGPRPVMPTGGIYSSGVSAGAPSSSLATANSNANALTSPLVAPARAPSVRASASSSTSGSLPPPPMASPPPTSATSPLNIKSPAPRTAPSPASLASVPLIVEDPVISEHIRDLQSRLALTNRTIADKDKDLADGHRRRAQAIAESTRAAEEADSRLAELEKYAARNQRALADLQSQKNSLQRQLEETRLAITRAETRSDELLRDQLELDRRLRETNAAVGERERALTDENEQFLLIKSRLERRIVELEEDCNATSERIRRTEAANASQEIAWREEEETLQKELDATTELLADTNTRIGVLEAELAEREKEVEQARQFRERRIEELANQRAEERQADLAKAKAALELRERQLLKEREEVLNGLRQQVEQVSTAIEVKQRNVDAQHGVVAELQRHASTLQLQVQRKAQLAQECSELNDKLQQTQEERLRLVEEVKELHAQLISKDDEIAQLDNAARRLAQRLDEEKRLKARAADLAKEVADAELQHNGERASAEASARQREREIARAKEDLRLVIDEIENARRAHEQEAEAAQRRIQALRSELTEKEAALSRAMSDNAAKQAAIAQFEEEKRRLERESLARKAAATQAAKAALQELTF